MIGNNAQITVGNSGNSTSNSTNPSEVGVADYQVYVSQGFTAGENLQFIVTNQGTNTGNQNSSVGYISQEQITFNGTCTFGNGSLISAANSGIGTVNNGAQIDFRQGFS